MSGGSPRYHIAEELRVLEWVRRRTPQAAVPLARAATLLGETPVVWTAVGASALLAAARSRRWGPLLRPICTLAAAAGARRALAEMIDRPRLLTGSGVPRGRVRAFRLATRPWARWVPGWWPARWRRVIGRVPPRARWP